MATADQSDVLPTNQENPPAPAPLPDVGPHNIQYVRGKKKAPTEASKFQKLDPSVREHVLRLNEKKKAENKKEAQKQHKENKHHYESVKNSHNN